MSSVTHDSVRSPAHYCVGTGETIDFIREVTGHGFAAYCAGNVLKYIARAGRKGGAGEDYAKAAFYAQMAAHVVEPARYDDPRDSR